MKKDKEFFRGALIGALAMFCVIAGGNALWKWASMAGFLPESLSVTSEVENKLYLLEQMVDKYYLYHDEIDKDTQAEGILYGIYGRFDGSIYNLLYRRADRRTDAGDFRRVYGNRSDDDAGFGEQNDKDHRY